MIRSGVVVECVQALDKRLHLSEGEVYKVRQVIGSMVSVSDYLGPINALFQINRFKVADDQKWKSAE